VNKLPGFLDAQNANLFVMYSKARSQIKFEHRQSRTVIYFHVGKRGMVICLILHYSTKKIGNYVWDDVIITIANQRAATHLYQNSCFSYQYNCIKNTIRSSIIVKSA
jgi:hypothetical protein